MSVPVLESNSLAVLLVDGDPATTDVAAELRAAGFAVQTAPDGPAALRALRDVDARVVAVNLVLTGMSGLLFTRALKSDPATSNIAVVAYSEVNGPEIERVARDSGCAAYLRKPNHTERFAASLAAVLKEHACSTH